MTTHERAMGFASGVTLDRAVAQRIRWVGLDVDGVLTDAGVYIGVANGAPVELKRFDIQDGVGIKMLQWAGLDVALVSGRVSAATDLRAAELGITDVVQDNRAHKVLGIDALLRAKGIAWADACFLGDDLPDLAVFERVGLPVATGNATADAVSRAHVHLTKSGGYGAVREFAELLLRARDQWDDLVARYVAERSGHGS